MHRAFTAVARFHEGPHNITSGGPVPQSVRHASVELSMLGGLECIMVDSPEILYKYRAVTPYTVPMLERSAIWAAQPASFNDPFDCKASVLADITEMEREHQEIFLADFTAALRQGLREFGRPFGFSRTKQKELLKRIDGANSFDDAYRVFERAHATIPIRWPLLGPRDFIAAVERRLNEVGVVALAGRVDSMLMWTHYADNHRGFCLGFDRTVGTSLADNQRCRPVKYVSEFPSLNVRALNVTRSVRLRDVGMNEASVEVDAGEANVNAVIYSKAIEWSYEQEWRFVVETGDREIPYPAPLKEVVFGLRCPADVRRDVMNAVSINADAGDIRFCEIIAAGDSFSLAVREMPATA